MHDHSALLQQNHQASGNRNRTRVPDPSNKADPGADFKAARTVHIMGDREYACKTILRDLDSEVEFTGPCQ